MDVVINSLTRSEDNNYLTNAYKMFVFSIRSEVTIKYYERSLFAYQSTNDSIPCFYTKAYSPTPAIQN